MAAKQKRRKNPNYKAAKEFERCDCGPDAERTLCREFFEGARDIWPMLWQDDRLRATVKACEQLYIDMEPIELDRMSPEHAYESFFDFDDRWRGHPFGVNQYWRHEMLLHLHKDLMRDLGGLIAAHTLAASPAGSLAVALNEEALAKKDPGQ